MKADFIYRINALKLPQHWKSVVCEQNWVNTKLKGTLLAT